MNEAKQIAEQLDELRAVLPTLSDSQFREVRAAAGPPGFWICGPSNAAEELFTIETERRVEKVLAR